MPDFLSEKLRRVNDVLTKTQTSSCGFSLEVLLGNAHDASRRIDMMKFLRNAILLCLTAFPRNHILEEAVLVAEDMFLTKMNSCSCSVTPCRGLAKGLLKNDRQVLLYFTPYEHISTHFISSIGIYSDCVKYNINPRSSSSHWMGGKAEVRFESWKRSGGSRHGFV